MTYKIFASCYKTVEEMEKNRLGDLALERITYTPFINADSSSFFDAVDELNNKYAEDYPDVFGTGVTTSFFVLQGSKIVPAQSLQWDDLSS